MTPHLTERAPEGAPSKNPESGYALLFVYVMAATIAIMLYMQVPRIAFEAQREKEQLLIDRGEQYKRGIQLYVRKFNRFPADMQALENTQNIRFLRKQYVDPMTGKNEWRLIHVGPNGALLDSKISTTQSKGAASAPQTFITELQPIGGFSNENQGINLANRRRASEEPGSPGDPNNPGGAASGPVMVLPDGRIVPATSTGVPGSAAPTTTAGGALPGQQPGAPVQPGQVLPGGFQQTANTPNAPSGGAANLINQILTTPRPGGFNGQGSTDPSSSAGITGGIAGGTRTIREFQPEPDWGAPQSAGGIAGVASKREQEGIKIYNSQTAYQKWEFIYDMSKDKTRGGGAAIPGLQQVSPGQQQPGATSGQPVASPVTTPTTGSPGTGNEFF